MAATNPTPPAVRSFNLADGSAKGTYAFPSPAFCNDMAFDGNHNLYVTDSFGKIYRLPDGGSALAVWSSDPKLASAMPMGFGADGIVWDGKSSLYVTSFTDGALLRIPINPDGTAGAASTVSVTPALNLPDGLRLLDQNTLLLVEGVGRLTRVAVSGSTGTATTIKSGLNGPTSVVHYGS